MQPDVTQNVSEADGAKMVSWRDFVVRFLGVAMMVAAYAAPAAAQSSDQADWDGADYESLAGFITALGEERYTGLIFKRISGDLARGDLEAVRPLLRRYYEGRRAAGPGGRQGIGARLHEVGEEARAAIPAAKKAKLEIPEYMVEPFVDLISSGGFNAAADINMDGVVNLLDVGPFIELLSGN